MLKIFGVKGDSNSHVGVFYCKDIESCKDVVKGYKLSLGVILNNENNVLGYIRGNSEIAFFKENVQNSYNFCYVLENKGVFVNLETLDRVHRYLEENEVDFGFIIEDGNLKYIIEEGALVDRKYF